MGKGSTINDKCIAVAGIRSFFSFSFGKQKKDAEIVNEMVAGSETVSLVNSSSIPVIKGGGWSALPFQTQRLNLSPDRLSYIESRRR